MLSAKQAPANELKETQKYYIDVSPRLILGGQLLPLDTLSIFSVISKLMGQYPNDWKKHLEGISQREYNMVHFTPLMERGDSNSPYSLYDQVKFDSTCFPNGEKDVADLISHMEEKYHLLGLTDVVWNHTANNSEWLESHPQAGYNIETAPWLESALELDTALLKYGNDLTALGLPSDLKNVDDLKKVMDGMKVHVIEPLRLWEYYVVNVERDAQAAVSAWTRSEATNSPGTTPNADISRAKDWSLKQQADYLFGHGLNGRGEMASRFHRCLVPQVAAALLNSILGKYKDNHEASAKLALKTITKILDELNLPFYREYDTDENEILKQVFNRIKYVRLDDHGPKAGPMGGSSTLVESYFTRLPLNDTTTKHNRKSLALVNNGWIWAADAMKDHAGSDSRAYLRREVIVWSDCVKLRYGKSPKDNPFLWDFMTKYTRLMAKYFAGFRIDNCHSTPIYVAEYLLDQARQVRPNLAVFAELFTGSEEMDYLFVKRLGLSALIREAMQAWSTQELSRLVHKHGGRPIGSFEVNEVSTKTPSDLHTQKHESVQKIKKSPLHALFMDCTHDNEVPAQKRDARDTLPNATLVNMCACATGSVMGYDEIYPRLVDLVHETRLYTSPCSEKKVTIGSGEGGIGGIKKLLNQIHVMMGKEGYDETHIHHEGEYITVHRVHPLSRKGYFAIAHTAFPGHSTDSARLSPVHLTGTKAKMLGSWLLKVDADGKAKKDARNDKACLKGLPSKVVDLDSVKLEDCVAETVISIQDEFPPGGIALFETWIPGAEHSEGLDTFVTGGAKSAFDGLGLVDLNFVLYRCDAEERDFSAGADGVYTVPDYGALVYAGLQGWWSVLREVIRNNDLGHPICNHLRDGQWALDYIVNRLEKLIKREEFTSLRKLVNWFDQRFQVIRKLPSFLLPRYFALIIQTAYNAAWERAVKLMGDDVTTGSEFLQQLAMVSVQQSSLTKSASLWPIKSVSCLAAGLPHFTTDWARCWGRDVFISVRGLFLATGRYDDAREHILAFASVLKHGMIPNLLSSGKAPRYNSRDSIWFFLQTIQDFTEIVPNGISILKEVVKRRFLPYDDTHFEFDDPRAYSTSSTIEEIVQEAMQRHAEGMSFREANAGPGLDMQMKPEGFQLDVKVDWKTGIIFGGNQFNCGTWMDKMGESEKAGSKGVPGTPRDGAAIEITGLLYSTLIWLSKLHKEGKYTCCEVKPSPGETITFVDWADKIKSSFERCYYVPLDPNDDRDFDVDSNIVNRRGIYKDLYRSGKPFEDYQLRCNFPIAMTVAPDLFTPSRAFACLELADKVIRGPTGMATLDPSDLNYRPYYINSEDSHDFATSKGRNYHQGPEWIWPAGYFLRALLKFDLMRRKTKEERTEAFQQVTQRLERCKEAISKSPWAGLAELTNKNGSLCADSVST